MEHRNKKLGGSNKIQGGGEFIDWKIWNKLLDIPFHGVNYTWTNNREGKEVIYERLDKAFCNDEWKLNHYEAHVTNIPILLSDHNPIIQISRRRKDLKDSKAGALNKIIKAQKFSPYKGN